MFSAPAPTRASRCLFDQRPFLCPTMAYAVPVSSPPALPVLSPGREALEVYGKRDTTKSARGGCTGGSVHR